VITVSVREDDSIKAADVFTQHLLSEIWPCINYKTFIVDGDVQ
jgi:hypothetical protein